MKLQHFVRGEAVVDFFVLVVLWWGNQRLPARGALLTMEWRLCLLSLYLCVCVSHTLAGGRSKSSCTQNKQVCQSNSN